MYKIMNRGVCGLYIGENKNAGWSGLIARLGYATLLTTMLIGCATQETLQAFTTDGCSRFPDRALVGKADWCHCCVAHDLAYWRGGTAQQRLEADRALRTCVIKASGNKILAKVMYAGVRAGGGPQANTSYRWGYGWSYGRQYEPLTPEEEAAASRLEGDYREKHPVLTCPN